MKNKDKKEKKRKKKMNNWKNKNFYLDILFYDIRFDLIFLLYLFI